MPSAVRRALRDEWDPIGVSYAPTLVASLLVHDHPEVIEQELRKILGAMGLEQAVELRAFAVRLLEIGDEVAGRKPLRAD